MSESPHAPSPPHDEGALVRRIAAAGPALVALSGGVDSALVAALAFDALGRQVVAVTLSGPAVAASEVERARRVAGAIGVEHHVLSVDPLERSEYRANPSNRCYFCRSVETARLRSFGATRGVLQYLDGIHLDDLAVDRPGLLAMNEAGFVHPLSDGGWRKVDVRRAARARGLPNAEQPSDACLASRVAHGQAIDGTLLARIEAAEAILLARSFRRVRVRVRGRAARIQVDPDEVERLSTAPLAEEVVDLVRRLGFGPVEIDPDGYGGPRPLREEVR